jgi:DNA-binding NtrC family response regulator
MTARGRVLVVDDDPQMLDMLREVVEYLGYEASAAASGEKAIAAMATVRQQLVFLDLLLPGISGLEVLNYIREHHPTVPVIVLTGNIDHRMASEARAAGAFAVVGKPIDLNTLRDLVAQALVPRP